MVFFCCIFQVGNAVPPPMAREIGHEIKKCMKWKLLNEENNPRKEVTKEIEHQNKMETNGETQMKSNEEGKLETDKESDKMEIKEEETESMPDDKTFTNQEMEKEVNNEMDTQDN